MFFKCQRTEGWFFWHPPACFPIYGNVYPPHWSIGREGGDSGFRRSRIWILVSRNQVSPLPHSFSTPLPSLPSIPLPLVLEAGEENVSVLFPSGLGITSLQKDSEYVRGSESQRRVSCLTSREYIIIARANGIAAPRPWVYSPDSWLTCRAMRLVTGSTAALIWGVDSCCPRGVLLTVGFRMRLCLRKNSICV